MKKGFTLAEILITLTIIGVVAALTMPAIMTNVTQHQYKTGLKKALNVLNDSIQTNLAMEGDTPFAMSDENWDVNGDGRFSIQDAFILQDPERFMSQYSSPPAAGGLAAFLMRHVNVTKAKISMDDNGGRPNFAFYTQDGLRFEVPYPRNAASKKNEETGILEPIDDDVHLRLYESDDIRATSGSICGMQEYLAGGCTRIQACGSAGLITNPNRTNVPPCIIMVDVNGDKKPNPKNNSSSSYAFTHNSYQVPQPDENILSDVFTILVTDRHAIPYGVVAQRTIYDEEQ